MAQFEMLDVFRSLLAANVPVKLESLPGAGKTSYMNALVRASGGYMHTMVAVNHDPTDFGGIPKPMDDRYLLLPGDWARQLSDACDKYDLVLLFLDEVNTAGRAVLSALLKVVDERRVGELQLPPKVRIVLAMNPAEANGGVDLTPAMANRVGHLPFGIPLKDWAHGMRDGFPDPTPLVLPDEAELHAETLKVAAEIADYAGRNINGFEQYPDSAEARSKAWASRRTWTLGARGIAAARLLGYSESVQTGTLASLVGQNAADGFADWLDARANLVDVGALLKDPSAFTIPPKDDALFATLDMVTGEALGRGDGPSIEAACVILEKVLDAGRPGVAAAAIRNIAHYLQANRSLVTPVITATLRKFKPVLDQANGTGASWSS